MHLAIARGKLAQLAQFSDDARPGSETSFPPPPYYVFGVALQHISLAEPLIGAAQSAMMRSLTYQSYVRRYFVVDETVAKRYRIMIRAFMIDERGTSIDVVGMAAALGMTLYVCERLGISTASQGNIPEFPSLNEYCTNIDNHARLKWTRLSQSGEPQEGVEHALRASSYRQILGRYLRLDSNAPMDSGSGIDSDPEFDPGSGTDARTHSLWANDAREETYLLSCCSPSCQDLIRILLHNGANPMAEVASVNSNFSKRKCFWARWLEFLHDLRANYIEANGRSGGILLDDKYLNLMLTPKTVFDITKALLAHGADVNFTLKAPDWDNYGGIYLKRKRPEDSRFGVDFDATAMFVLEECFNKEAEFREFAIAIKPYIEKPTRRLVRIMTRSARFFFGFDVTARLSPEICEPLWPLIEEWERTGYATDLELLQSAMEGVWKIYGKAIELTCV